MAVTDPILSLQGISKTFALKPILSGVNLTIHEGDRTAILGINGSGKSTLLRIIAGEMAPDAGEVRRRRNVSLGYLHQQFVLDDQATVGAWIAESFQQLRELHAELDEVHHSMAGQHSEAQHERLLKRQAELTHELERHEAWSADARASEAKNALGLPPDDRVIGTLSGGEKRRVALCRVLLQDPDLLILDEPTNHLDTETLEWLEGVLSRWRGTVVLVTHDRFFLDRVATRMVELDQGVAREYDGSYSDYLEAKALEGQQAEQGEAKRQKLLRTELAWLRRQPKARTTKNKARVQAAEALAAQTFEVVDKAPDFLIPDGPRLGKTVLAAEKVSLSLAGRQLIRDMSFTMAPGDRWGIVGPNGAGKTTLLRLLLGELEPESGRLERGQNVQSLYADQHRTRLNNQARVLEEIAGEATHVKIGGELMPIRVFARRFLFSDEMLARPIEKLSGGERSRVVLAKLLRQGGNLIALDEPTNDLDLFTLRVLEEALAAFPGCALVVSHDRWFLDRVATGMLWVPGDGSVHQIAGNYEDFLRYRDRVRAGQAEAAPQKVAPTPVKEAAKAEPVSRRKLSYKEQREFDTMEEEILKAEERLAALEEKLANPAPFSQADTAAVRALAGERDAAQATVEHLYHRWAELSDRA